MQLSESFLAPFRRQGDPFQTLLARSTYLGKYSRNDHGRQETWTDTITRVVNDSIAQAPKHCTPQEAEQLFQLFWSMKGLPAGRGLWTAGAPGIPAAARYNCWTAVIRSVEDWAWCMDMLMLGGGVGLSLAEYRTLPEVALAGPGGDRLTILCRAGHPDLAEVKPDGASAEARLSFPNRVLPDDSRQGWVAGFRAVAKAAYLGQAIAIDVSDIRCRGSIIKTFGGLAAGPGPLVELLRFVHKIIRGAARRQLTSVECLDITNVIGKCVKSGNVRRSALLVAGNPRDQAFRNAKKDFEAVKAYRHTSNNSVIFETEEELRGYDWDAAVEDLITYGEPGFLNLWLARQTDPDVVVCNPCQPAWATVLTPAGIRTIGDLKIGDLIWSGKKFTKVVNKWSTGVKEVLAYRTRAGTFFGTDKHRVVQYGEKVEVGQAEAIDTAVASGDSIEASPLAPQDVMDGLVCGDGWMRKDRLEHYPVLCIGAHDQDYFKSEIAQFLLRERASLKGWEVQTTIKALPKTYEREIPQEFFQGDTTKMRGFLRGLYTANGSVVGNRVTLKASSFRVIEQAQQMLSALGFGSYYTVNKSSEVKFSNGDYTCRQSYDLNIGSAAGRCQFKRLIGFIQAYKNEKLDLCSTKSVHSKNTFDIVETEIISTEEVFDLTVEAEEHTYWTGGMLVSNCAEEFQENHESCNLVEGFPALCGTQGEAHAMWTLLTRHALRQRLAPIEDPEADRVRVKNMRLGVALGGICSFQWNRGMLMDWFRRVRKTADTYADELGVAHPRTVTTVEPSGTKSLLNGSSPGFHSDFAPFYVRRVRIASNEPMAEALMDAEVPFEKDVYDASGHTLVFEFPMKAQPGTTITTRNETVRGQFERLLAVQQNWSDNSVSATISFDAETERQELASCLRSFMPKLKSVSCLPRAHGYQQAPYTEIDGVEYARRHSRIDHKHPLTAGGELATEGCIGGSCPVR